MAQDIEDFIEEKARAGDGSFAIAFAILQLARHHDVIGAELMSIGETLNDLNVNISISGPLDTDNG